MAQERLQVVSKPGVEKIRKLQPELKRPLDSAKGLFAVLVPIAEHVKDPKEQDELPIRLWPIRQPEGIDAGLHIADMLLLNLGRGRRLALCQNQMPTLVKPLDFGFRAEYFKPVNFTKYLRMRLQESPPLGEVELEVSRWQHNQNDERRLDLHDKTICGQGNNYSRANYYTTTVGDALDDAWAHLASKPHSIDQVAA